LSNGCIDVDAKWYNWLHTTKEVESKEEVERRLRELSTATEPLSFADAGSQAQRGIAPIGAAAARQAAAASAPQSHSFAVRGSQAAAGMPTTRCAAAAAPLAPVAPLQAQAPPPQGALSIAAAAPAPPAAAVLPAPASEEEQARRMLADSGLQ
jgi:hypothetical protein